MRLITFIMSFFIFTLSLLPCTDHQEESERHTTELSGRDHHDEHGEKDSCTPLCYCSCCGCGGYVVSIPELHFTSIKIKILPVIVPDYYTDFTSTYFYSFWQPPKLS